MIRLALPLVFLVACSGSDDDRLPDTRAACARRDPLRQVLFGDLHVHTSYSFDAHAFEVKTTPDDAYDFARGQEVDLGTTKLRIDRPLDFAAVTDHSEFLGEVETCSVPGSSDYNASVCETYRKGGNIPVTLFGLGLTGTTWRPNVCMGTGCPRELGQVWQRIQDAAERAYDRTSACTFTSFVAYEYSAAVNLSTGHRNVIFRGRNVPAPATYFENPTPKDLWQALETTCTPGGGCDVLAIPHNSNESNGNMFFVEYPDATTPDEQREAARRRVKMEPVVEVYQHKSSSECMNGLSGILGGPDEQCDFEIHKRTPLQDCGDTRGSGGVARIGCFSRLDFLRGALLAGLAEEQRLGVNPYQLGFIGSTDTHNGTPGAVSEQAFIGHRGTDDDTAAKQLSTGGLTPGGIEFSPGGLAAVWAEENSRDSIFEALRRREVYATSGPRITLRLFGGWELPESLCGDPKLVEKAAAGGVPMGGSLPRRTGQARPRFVVAAQKDGGTTDHPGTDLERIQIVKGWIDASGAWHQKIVDVAGGPNGAGVDPATCAPTGSGGAATLCAVYSDEAFEPGERAYYYARVLENPTCRWSTYKCNALPAGERPPTCSDTAVQRTIKERAWSSPIWYAPAS